MQCVLIYDIAYRLQYHHFSLVNYLLFSNTQNILYRITIERTDNQLVMQGNMVLDLNGVSKEFKLAKNYISYPHFTKGPRNCNQLLKSNCNVYLNRLTVD